ncbi:sensor histidine kinase [Nonomuraea sp. NPDC059194]|uniref:sensor histidine kinase n=1 Tax=Nonomuraea sp. NPDC059194 TaxID=3346764 RepID=UPI00369BED47
MLDQPMLAAGPPAGAPKGGGPLWWRSWRSAVFDVLLTLCLVAATLVDFASTYPGLPPWLRALQLLAVAAGTLCFVLRRVRPVLVTVVALAMLPLGSDLLTPFAVYALARYRQADRTMLGLIGLTFVADLVMLWFGLPDDLHAPGSDWWLDAAIVVSLIIVPALFAAHRRTRLTLVEQLRERAEQLERERHLVATQALAQERARMAREMHDVVAHQIGLVVVYSNVLQTAAADDPAQLREIGQRMGDSGRAALQELRAVITMLRGTGTGTGTATTAAPGLPALRALVEESAQAGMPVTLHVAGTERALPEPVTHTVFRLTQEALTNVRKHAGGAPTEVSLCYDPASVRLVVRNARPGEAAPGFEALPSSGHGLVGMRERVAACDGTFAAGPTPDGGFEVRVELPAVAAH